MDCETSESSPGFQTRDARDLQHAGFRLPADDLKFLKQQARVRRLSQSEVLRQMIQTYRSLHKNGHR